MVELDSIIQGDCIEVMKDLPADFFDAIVTDPPYGLSFQGHDWDKFKSPKSDMACFQEWTTEWATEAMRVLKPGASLMCFGGDRTFHRLGCGLEDAGFFVKSGLSWVYASGFPKAQDLSKIIDRRLGVEDQREVIGERHRNVKPFDEGTGWNPNDTTGDFEYTAPASELAREWDGFKIGSIKPAWEPILWCLKPPEGSYLDNVLKHNTGFINVDECRIGLEENAGRFPANFMLTHSPQCERLGTRVIKGDSRIEIVIPTAPTDASKCGHEFGYKPTISNGVYGDEEVEVWKCVARTVLLRRSMNRDKTSSQDSSTHQRRPGERNTTTTRRLNLWT